MRPLIAVAVAALAFTGWGCGSGVPAQAYADCTRQLRDAGIVQGDPTFDGMFKACLDRHRLASER